MTFSLMSVLAFDKSLQGLHLHSGKLLTPPCALTQPRHLESEKVQNCSISWSMIITVSSASPRRIKSLLLLKSILAWEIKLDNWQIMRKTHRHVESPAQEWGARPWLCLVDVTTAHRRLRLQEWSFFSQGFGWERLMKYNDDPPCRREY